MLNFESLDPSDALRDFVHRMSFKKTKGFARVEALSRDAFGRVDTAMLLT
jgi:hypothetical protein